MSNPTQRLRTERTNNETKWMLGFAGRNGVKFVRTKYSHFVDGSYDILKVYAELFGGFGVLSLSLDF